MRIFFQTFGCRVNQYETQALRERLMAEPSSVPADRFHDAELCVVNTCTVTRAADQEALRLLRRIARSNPRARLIVTGCLASRSPQEVLKAAPAACVMGNDKKQDIPGMLGCSPVPESSGISGLHRHSRVFVKVQDGCDMRCTYCVVPSVRPGLSCKPYALLEKEIRGLVDAGISEVVLCGIRLGRYRVKDDSGRRLDLLAMLERLLALPGDFRIRLSSLEVTDLTERFLEGLSKWEGRFCPSFHVPLQSGSRAMLKSMGRSYTPEFYARRIQALRSRWPDAGLFTDVMVGFPGETSALFEESLRFVEGIGYSGLHVFRYSKRPGTPAARYRGEVPEDVVRVRSRHMHGLDARLRADFAGRAVASVRRVLVERGGDRVEGVTEHFLRVRLPADCRQQGLVWAKITHACGALAHAIPWSEGPSSRRDERPLRQGARMPYSLSMERCA